MPLLPRPRHLFLASMFAGAALITASSLAYFDPTTLPPFAIERMPDLFAAPWLAALRVHVASALLSFPLCLLLSTRPLQRRRTLHRRLGRVTGALVLFALVPSGALLALHAKGGAPVGAGFLLSAAILAWSIVRGVLAARAGDLFAHRHAMHHAVAQMSVAVTSRALLFGLDTAGVDPDLAYVVALWLPVLGSAAAVEIVSGRSLASLLSLVERSRRALSPSPRPVRVRPDPRPLPRPGR